MKSVTILFEDARTQGVVKEYGPEVLVKQCVCDRLDLERWKLKSLIGIPRNGNGNVRKDCTQNSPKFGRDGGLVFAVYDSDKIRELIKLPFEACKTQVRNNLLEECPWGDRLRIVFLEKNLETVLGAIRDCDHLISSEEQWTKAIDRKDLGARDIIFKATAAPPARPLRDRVLNEVPSLAYLIQNLVHACSTLGLFTPAA